ncbi:tetratricopeptide repeat protein [Herbaspirillum rubrisubalbicans]|uniref:tetratricopeptide repeat protein n=1 Tax=Herbaspirillum rubrisubalbicans TaxID=80842 RepID=UPI000DD2D79F|nr:tetratricopeptide repeat protein [Herbaspirillum rubrisubalbicans]
MHTPADKIDMNTSVAQQKLTRLVQYLKSDPDNDTLRAEVFDTALQCAALDEARFQLQHALHLQPRHPAWLHRRALLALRENLPQEAQQVLEGLIAEGNTAAGIRFNLGYAFFMQGQWERAASVVESLRGPVSQQMDRTVVEQAWALWLRCQHHLRELTEALQIFSTASLNGSVGADSFGVASLIAFDAQQMERADSWSERALREQPQQQEALVTRASLALAEQDSGAAYAFLQRALQSNPDDGRAWSAIAFCHLLKRDYISARHAFGRAIKAMAGHIGTWIGLGWCEFANGQAWAAYAAFQRALELDPNFAESHGGLAVALIRMEQVERAKVEINVALRLDRNSLSARYAQAMLNGDADDPAKLMRLSRRLLAQYPAPGISHGEKTLADVVLRDIS